MGANTLRKRLVSKRQLLLAVLIGVATLLVAFGLTALSLTPVRYDLAAGEVAPVTFTATREVVDKISTQAAQEEARAQVSPMYKMDDSVTQTVLQAVSDYFDAAQRITETLRDEYVRWQVKESNYGVTYEYYLGIYDPSEVDWGAFLTQELKDGVRETLGDAGMPDDAIEALAAMTGEQVAQMGTDVGGMVAASLEGGVREENLQTEKNDLLSAIESNYPDANGYIAYFPVKTNFAANMILDEAATQQAMEEAAQAVAPVVYKQSQTIVAAGEVVTEAQLAVLAELGLVGGEETGALMYVGMVLFLGAMLAVFAVYLYQFEAELLADMRKMVAMAVIVLVVIALSLALAKLDSRIMTVFFSTMLVCVLVSQRSALVLNVVLSFVLTMIATWQTGLLSTQMLTGVTASIIGGSVSVYVLYRPAHRSSLIFAGLIGGGAGMVTLLLLNIVGGATLEWETLIVDCAFALGSGLLAGVLAIGTLPIWEAVFRISTPAKLLELSNLNHPLLKRLTIEAPGTYHHSILTANLAEAGADAVGANVLLCRVGAYFHDVGKLKAPRYFMENQKGENPHDAMDPRESAKVIIGHVTHGLELAHRYKLPREVQLIIAQHHGDSLVPYFYHKAQEAGLEPVEKAFRYQGGKPSTRESAIVMLADCVEAAVRSMDDPDREQVRDMIDRLIRGKYDDGQLDECPLNRRDLNTLAKAFLHVFDGALHERVKYPGQES